MSEGRKASECFACIAAKTIIRDVTPKKDGTLKASKD